MATSVTVDIDSNVLFAANVRRERRAAGLTQEKLASKAGVSAQYISKIERNKCSPTVKTITAIAESLDVPPASLFAVDEESVMYAYTNLEKKK